MKIKLPHIKNKSNNTPNIRFPKCGHAQHMTNVTTNAYLIYLFIIQTLNFGRFSALHYHV